MFVLASFWLGGKGFVCVPLFRRIEFAVTRSETGCVHGGVGEFHVSYGRFCAGVLDFHVNAMTIRTALLGVAVLLAVQPAAAAYNEYDALVGVYYSNVAYCNRSAIERWQCGKQCRFFPGVANVTVAAGNKAKVQGYVAYNPARHEVVMSFRNGVNLANVLQDLDWGQTAFAGAPAGSKVHKGFYADYKVLRPTLMPALLALVRAYPTASIFVTGHSLGAALSQFGYLDVLRSVNATTQTTLYNFGCPRVGNPAFAKWADSFAQPGAHYRLVNATDPVPHIPAARQRYIHLPREVWYDAAAPEAAGYEVCAGSAAREDPACSDSVKLDLFDFKYHLYYLNIRMECAA
jgi:hypothetical protein